MKILDRYVILSFLRNYLVSFLVLVGMYIVLDMIFNFDELVEINEKAEVSGLKAMGAFLLYAGDFYLYQVPLYFKHLAGIIPVVAAAFTLMRMIRFNELSALLSSGVPLLRVAMPIILASIVLQGLVWVDQEYLIPSIIPKLIRSHDHKNRVDTKSYEIQALRDDAGGKVFAGRYFPNQDPPRIVAFDVVYQDENYRPTAHIRADEAVWDQSQGRWRLTGGVLSTNITRYRTEPLRTEPIAFYKGVTPTQIRLFRSGSFVDLLSTRAIDELLDSPSVSYGRADLLRVKHTRAAQFLVNIILLLLAISAVLTREPAQLKLATTRCVILCGGCLSMVFGAQELTGKLPIALAGDQWPALVAWLPIFIFGPVAVWLLDRVKT